MIKHTAIFVLIVCVMLLSACGPTERQIQEAISMTQTAQPTNTVEPTATLLPTATSTPTTKPTAVPTKTKTPKPTPTPTEAPQDFLKFEGGYLTFNSDIWKVTSDSVITSLQYPDCMILTYYGHGYDDTKIRVVNEYDEYNGVNFYFDEYRWKDTDEPAFTNVKWGPNQMYVVEIQSPESGWSCFRDALGVFWQSSLAGFEKP